MKRVKNKIMYQVATDRDYKVGDKFVFGKELNGQGRRALFKSKEEYDHAIREIAVEAARLKTNKKLPSRMRCMFLSEDKEVVLKGVRGFWQKGRGEKGNKQFQVVAVKLNGKLFLGDAYKVHICGESFDYYYKAALEYWKGADNTIPEKNKEFIFEGTAEIVEILDEYIHTPVQ